MRAVCLSFLAIAACATATDDASDGEASDAAPQAIGGKADGATTGLFASRATTHYNGDVPDLELRADGSFVRLRCYHASCALPVAETDHYDTYTSSAGKTYVRFYSFTVETAADGSISSTPLVADVYEIRTTSTGIRLRKAFSTRWQTLATTDAATRCTASGGAWNGDCSCPGSGNGATPHPAFAPGAGGCIIAPGGGEDACDSSNGLYTDDDATPIGTFCECGLGRHVVDAGSCAAI